jgi:hypothetical protein
MQTFCQKYFKIDGKMIIFSIRRRQNEPEIISGWYGSDKIKWRGVMVDSTKKVKFAVI